MLLNSSLYFYKKEKRVNLMNNKDKRMDPLVQMLRILGACMVIGTHIKPDILVDGIPVASRTVIACFVGEDRKSVV